MSDAGRARRYPSDTTDAQWAVIDPLLPDPPWLAGKGGRRETHCRRAVVDAIFFRGFLGGAGGAPVAAVHDVIGSQGRHRR
ncbi:transposase [Sciscionella marina]|uniref:transposase n=1 Tax=Sciscionella marina TaxID=508770 RepID=UPI003B835400